MITHEEKVLQNVVKQFDGLSKLEAYDILYKIESLLVSFSSPIQFVKIKESLESSRNKKITPIGYYGHCYLEDQCQYLNIYRIKSILPSFFEGGSLYFTVPGHYDLIAFDNRNIEEAFSNMHLKSHVHQFLKGNNVKRRNPKTNRLLLLDLFDQIDPK